MSLALTQDRLGDLLARGGVLAEAEGVEGLVDERGLGPAGVPAGPGVELPRADVDHPAAVRRHPPLSNGDELLVGRSFGRALAPEHKRQRDKTNTADDMT